MKPPPAISTLSALRSAGPAHTGAVFHCANCGLFLHFTPPLRRRLLFDSVGRVLFAGAPYPALANLLAWGFVDFGETAESALRVNTRRGELVRWRLDYLTSRSTSTVTGEIL